MRALDDSYRTFFGLVATQIAAGLADAQALEEERRRAAALAEIDRAKTAFFSNVSHEFRTPLTLMLGPLEDLLANAYGPLPAVAVRALTLAHRNSLRLLKLVNSLLDFSRIEAGRVEASYEPTDLAAVTAELASVFRSAVERAGLQARRRLRAARRAGLRRPRHVGEDRAESSLERVQVHVRGRDRGGAARARRDASSSAFATRASASPAADLPKMFQRFHRVRNARSRTHEGSGIGLALVRELVKLHGGDVGLESREGVGTTFTVRLPKGKQHLPAERIGAARELATTRTGAQPFLEEALRWLPDDTRSSRSTSRAGRRQRRGRASSGPARRRQRRHARLRSALARAPLRRRRRR